MEHENPLIFKNTLTGILEKFEPINPGKVTMYNCGPTVYNTAHIGNLRAYLFADTIKRALRFNGYEVNQVINITDIGHLQSDGDDGDDKMTKALVRLGKPLTLEAMREVANIYFESFKKDLQKLNILPPDHFPFASDHIAEDITLVQVLIDKGFTYTTSDGIYFDTTKDPHYGKLGGSTSTVDDQSRIGTHAEKKNSRDFALWKFNTELGYDAEFGKGFPGWHIECSAMSMKYLGETFDIHTGGIDHIAIHHNNEIAQSENATGKPFAHVWMHSAFVNIDGGKMAKSEDNVITLQTLIDRNILPLSYRYWLLQARYDTQVQFSWEALESAQIAYIKLIKLFIYYKKFQDPRDIGSSLEYYNLLRDAVNNNLNTPHILSLLWMYLSDTKNNIDERAGTMSNFDEILGLNLEGMSTLERFHDQNIDTLPHNIQDLIQERETARKNKDWQKSDELRDALHKLGYTLEDSSEGLKVSLM